MRIRTTDCCSTQKGSGFVMTQEQSKQSECQTLIFCVQDFLARHSLSPESGKDLQMPAAHGWPRYGDPEYVPHVLRYYSGGGLFAGLFGNGQLVTIAKSQLGNEGGQKFWSWYGFDSREEWCACFVSWCADQAGLIQSGAVPKFSLCTDGKNWFQNQGRWQGAGSMPSPGAIIFFDWDHDGTCDHVGIVERCDGTTVYTIEGNSGDAVRERNYAIRSGSIMGYGMVVY